MLIIKKSSWHFKILTAQQKNEALYNATANKLSLCWYFWQVVFAIISNAAFTIVAIAIFLVLCVCVFITAYIWYFTIAYSFFDIMSFDNKLLVSSIIFNSIGLVSAFLYLSAMNIGYTYAYILKKRKEKSINLFSEYAKAKRHRLCPLMEIKE